MSDDSELKTCENNNIRQEMLKGKKERMDFVTRVLLILDSVAVLEIVDDEIMSYLMDLVVNDKIELEETMMELL